MAAHIHDVKNFPQTPSVLAISCSQQDVLALETSPKGAKICQKVPESATRFYVPFEGIPASLGPGLRTVSGAKRRTRWNSPIVCPTVPNPEKSRQSQRTQLAVAIAERMSVAAWARTNNVPKRTAFRWAREAKVRASVDFCRRRALDRAIGSMAKHVNWAANGIVTLARSANSESVRLAALRAVFSNMMAISEFAGLEGRMAQIEEKLRDESGNSTQTG
jgi:hypothetical protein